MDIAAGTLRHAITLQSQQRVKDSNDEYSLSWSDTYKDIAASVTPLSGREFLQSQAVQNTVVARVVIRYRTGVTPNMRMLFNNDVYRIEAVLPDPYSNRWLTLMVSVGVGDGA